MATNTDLKALKDLIDLLRANGVTSFEDGALKLVLGALPDRTAPELQAKRAELPKGLEGLPAEYLDPSLGLQWTSS